MQVSVRPVRSRGVHRSDDEQVGRIGDRFSQMIAGQAHDLPMPKLKRDLREIAYQLCRADACQAGKVDPLGIGRLKGLFDQGKYFFGVEASLCSGAERDIATPFGPPAVAASHL